MPCWGADEVRVQDLFQFKPSVLSSRPRLKLCPAWGAKGQMVKDLECLLGQVLGG